MMTKHYGRYGFQSDQHTSIRLIHVALELCEITCNGVYNSSWIIGIPCAISSMNAFFDKKPRQINILGKFPSDNNARNITHDCEFSNTVLRHAIWIFTSCHKRENTVLHFYVRSWKFAQRPLQIIMKIDMFFFLIATNARQMEPLYAQLFMFLLTGEYI